MGSTLLEGFEYAGLVQSLDRDDARKIAAQAQARVARLVS